MLKTQIFTFNIYEENTYVLSDDSHECVIIDPGCYTREEQAVLTTFLEEQKLSPKYLLNTHGHIDHMLGNAFIKNRYNIPFIAHQKITNELLATQMYGHMMGLNPDPSPEPDEYVDEGDEIHFGNTTLHVLYTPGHAEGHISFYYKEAHELYSGDVLFQRSIGRTDLPGGSYSVLMKSIKEKLLPLNNDTKVYPGHGPTTTIGEERINNQFLQGLS